MKITYDKIANAAYLYFKKAQKVTRTIPISEDVIVDFDSRGRILGIEILNASKNIDVGELTTPDFQLLAA